MLRAIRNEQAAQGGFGAGPSSRAVMLLRAEARAQRDVVTGIAAVALQSGAHVADVEAAGRFLLQAVMRDARARCQLQRHDRVGERFGVRLTEIVLDQRATAVAARAAR